MLGVYPLWEWLSRRPMAVLLPAQAALLFHNLALLPIWGDEQFTLDVVAKPWAEILAAVRADVHPPLYYLLVRCWVQIPWPATTIDQIRAFSVVCCLLSTTFVYWAWLRRLNLKHQWWFLAAWTFSPALLLYSRMGRSYTLQLLCGCLVVCAAHHFTSHPARMRNLLLYSGAAALLLYVHYLPGIALIAAAIFDYIRRGGRTEQGATWKPLLLSSALILALYLPWVWTLLSTVRRVATTDAPRLTSNYLVEHLVRLAYWFASFTYGETLPAWALIAALALGPLIAWSLWRHAASPNGPAALPATHLMLAAGIAYLGTAMWVSIPFTPARALFLLPFYLLWLTGAFAEKSKAALACGVSLLVVWLGAMGSYFQKEHFLNKGYLVPFSQMADSIKNISGPMNTLVIIDGYNVDPKPLVADVCRSYRCLVVRDQNSWQAAQPETLAARPENVWYLRATHDVSPEGLSSRLETTWRTGYESRRHLFLPYEAQERFALRLLGRENPSTHFYQMLEMRAR